MISGLLLAACSSAATPSENSAQAPLRGARPTFTPTIAVQQPNALLSQEQPQQQDNSDANKATSQPIATAPAAVETSSPDNDKPIVVVNDELVNTRNGPGLNFDLVDTVERGEQFDIVGKTADGGWWKICCVKGQQVWIVNQFVQTDGNVDSVPVINDFSPSAQDSNPPVAANPAPAAQPAATTAPAPTSAPASAPIASAFGFDLITQEQFPETNVVRVFLFVFEGSIALEGFSLRVVHNGVELPNTGTVSIGPKPSFTWPLSDTRQRLQNFKVEFPGEQPGGTWEIQLTLNNQPAGAVATFKLADNDLEREMYVRYQKK